ncbi:golgi-specific brefeldin A-resistance guanine nucleotide exchange factor 1 [Paragonimus westermani]|uniref:Golgi-specific brefeldin A-resistance guanine nucleotide exchange factor 1 n=1 Tax=Paragonimus westermani TaxID=34504 RepID=A0A5J4NHV8_9TREM|nr:golgi-specific brefeldin A-resistance guanine nucleotide exchange factor 1 [Paragonimus westermani]
MHLLHNHAADLPDPVTDWQLIFSLLEVCGAGLRAQLSIPSRTRQFHHSSMYDIIASRDHDSWQYATHLRNARGCTSDSEAPDLTYHSHHPPCDQTPDSGVQSERGESKQRHPGCGWIMVDGSFATHERPSELNGSCTAAPALKTQILTVSDDHPIGSSAQVPVEVSPNTVLTSSSFNEVNVANPLIPSRILGIQVAIGTRDPVTLKQAADCLDFLVRDPTYITPDNFEFCVRTLRVFVEACLRCQSTWVLEQKSDQSTTFHQNIRNQKRFGRSSGTRKPVTVSSRTNASESESDPETEEERCVQRSSWAKEVFLSPTTSVVAIQLLDLIHILLTRATSIYTEWTRAGSNTCAPTDNEDSSVPDSQLKSSEPEIVEHLWSICWRPLLQATARLCCDCRREVRTDALAYLQRALLSPTLQPLSGLQWEECFGMVLFPLLSGFLESIALEEVMCGNNQSGSSPISSSHFHTVEFVDPRMRAVPLLTKVFLQHLRPLHRSKNFHSIWIRILTYMEHYMQASSSDSLTDAVRESLKNVLLVMYTGTYDTPPILLRDASPDSPEAVLWELTTQRLSTFLPSLLDQLFPPSMPAVQNTVLHPQSSTTESSQSVEDICNQHQFPSKKVYVVNLRKRILSSHD